MRELEVLGLHSDGQHIVLTDNDGARYVVTITDKLRTLVRTDRKLVGALTNTTQSLSPREIQKLIRAGATSAEIATAYDSDEETIARFESAILAERRYIARRAMQAHLHDDVNAPTLGDLVIDRLATRGVSPDSIAWDATRADDDPWVVQVSFAQAAQELHATWSFDVKSTHLVALDEEAHWLTETTLTGNTSAKPVITPFPLGAEDSTQTLTNSVAYTSSSSARKAKPSARTLKILDSLAARRGKRIEIDTEDVISISPLPEYADDNDGTHTLESTEATAESTEAEIATLPKTEPELETLPDEEDPLPSMSKAKAPTENKRSKKARRSVPGWDEIIFGTKGE